MQTIVTLHRLCAYVIFLFYPATCEEMGDVLDLISKNVRDNQTDERKFLKIEIKCYIILPATRLIKEYSFNGDS